MINEFASTKKIVLNDFSDNNNYCIDRYKKIQTAFFDHWLTKTNHYVVLASDYSENANVYECYSYKFASTIYYLYTQLSVSNVGQLNDNSENGYTPILVNGYYIGFTHSGDNDDTEDPRT